MVPANPRPDQNVGILRFSRSNELAIAAPPGLPQCRGGPLQVGKLNVLFTGFLQIFLTWSGAARIYSIENTIVKVNPTLHLRNRCGAVQNVHKSNPGM